LKLKLKIFKKYFVLTVVVIVISLAFMLTILSFFMSNYLAKDKYAELKESCTAISDFTATYSIEDEWLDESFKFIMPLFSKSIDAEVLITDTNGKPHYCTCDIYKTEASCVHTSQNVSQRINSKVTSDDEFYEVGNFDGSLNDMYYIYGVKLTNNTGNNYAVIYAFSQTSSIRYIFMNIFRMFMMSSIATVVIMFVAVYYVSYKLTKPLTLMSEAARCMAKGDFSKRIPVTSDDEVGELALAFNNMTDSLVQLESTRRSFVANVSHELKTPMTTIGGFIDGIVEGIIPEEKHEEYLKIVSDEVKRLSRLVQSMLSLSRLESGEMKINPTEFSISSTLINIVVAQQQRIEAKNLNIVGLDSLEDITLLADSDLVHQVIYNLVDNAVKFSDEGGEIAFKLWTKNNRVYFGIRNTGEGINKVDLPHIFDRFFKSDKSRSAVKDSTGLGLFIVKTIIDIHGGKISVKSVPNQYTEFQFFLPIGK